MLGVKPSTSAPGSAPEVKMLKLWFKIPNNKKIIFFNSFVWLSVQYLGFKPKKQTNKKGGKKKNLLNSLG